MTANITGMHMGWRSLRQKIWVWIMTCNKQVVRVSPAASGEHIQRIFTISFARKNSKSMGEAKGVWLCILKHLWIHSPPSSVEGGSCPLGGIWRFRIEEGEGSISQLLHSWLIEPSPSQTDCIAPVNIRFNADITRGAQESVVTVENQ